jgi:hypothetical protein
VHLSSLASDSASQLDILGHDSDTLGVDSAQVGIFKETDEVGFSCLLQSQHSRALESKIGLEVLGDFSHQPLEGQLADQELGTLLVLPDLTKSDGSWPVSVRLLHSSCGRSRLPCCLSCQLLPGSLASRGLPGSLLGTSHLRYDTMHGSMIWSLKITELSRN